MKLPKEAPWPDVWDAGDARRGVPSELHGRVDLTVTSTPYWGKAVYGDDPDQFGAGPAEKFVDDQVSLAEAIWVASRKGAWSVLNLGDTRHGTGGAGGQVVKVGKRIYRPARVDGRGKEWMGIPQMSAQAIRARTGWQWAGHVIWRKPTPIMADCSTHHMERNKRPGLDIEELFFFWKPGGPKTWHTSVLADHRDPDALTVLAMLDRLAAAGVKLPAAERHAVKRLAARGSRALLGAVWDLPKHTDRPPRARPGDDVAAFPHALPDRLVRLLSNPGDLVLDPCGGWGTTARVANHLGRRGVALDPYWATRCWDPVEALGLGEAA